MKTKYTDTDESISTGGRAKLYWEDKKVEKNHRTKISNAVDIENEAVNLMELRAKFNLKGFEFGNWCNALDRQDFVIAAKSSLADLSKVMGSKNLGFDNMLGLAFGARGNGGRAAAHYEADLNMINLSKTKGSGTLAHEYGHALDYIMGRYIDQNKNHSALSGGWRTAAVLSGNTGGQLRYYTNKIIDTIKTTASYAKLEKSIDSEYWFRRTEVFARFWEQFVLYKLKEQKINNQFLCRSWSSYTTDTAYLSVTDFNKVLPDAEALLKEFSLFLNNKGKLESKPYHTVKNAKFVAVKETANTKKKAAAAKPVSNKSSKDKKL